MLPSFYGRKHQPPRTHPLVVACMLLFLVLIMHDLVMTSEASAASATGGGVWASTSFGADVSHDFHAEAPDSDTAYICTSIQSLSAPDRTFSTATRSTDANPMTESVGGVVAANEVYVVPVLPPEIRRAFLQVYRM